MENEKIISDLLKRVKSLNDIVSDSELRGMVNDTLMPFLKSKYGEKANFIIVANSEGDFIINREYTVVPEGLHNEEFEIEVTDERVVDDEFEIGEEYICEVPLSEFNPRETLTISSLLMKLINRITTDYIEDNYGDLVGTTQKFVVTGLDRSGYIMEYNKLQFILPFKERLPKENVVIGDTLYATVIEVGTRNLVTRKSDDIIKHLLSKYAYNDYDIIKMVRKVGVATKIAIDCRIDRSLFERLADISKRISESLNNEKVDIILYSDDLERWLRNSLFNIWTVDCWIDDNGEGNVLLDRNQLPFMIGPHGVNIKLLESLLEVKINLHINEMPKSDDIELLEYQPEIRKKFINSLAKQGLATARELMGYDRYKLPNHINRDELKKLLNLIREDFINAHQ